MNMSQQLCLHGVSTLGSTALAFVEIGAGTTTGMQMIAAAIVVVASGLCLGDQLFDQLHDPDEVQDDIR